MATISVQALAFIAPTTLSALMLLPALVLQAPSLVPMTRSALALRLSHSNRRRRYWRCRPPALALLVRKAQTMAKVP